MELEQIKPNKPNFALVGLLFALALIAIFVAAAVIVTWRAHNRNKTPFTKHPVSQLAEPLHRQTLA